MSYIFPKDHLFSYYLKTKNKTKKKKKKKKKKQKLFNFGYFLGRQVTHEEFHFNVMIIKWFLYAFRWIIEISQWK